MESKKYRKLVKIMKKNKTHRYREQARDHQWEEGSGEGQNMRRGERGTNY